MGLAVVDKMHEQAFIVQEKEDVNFMSRKLIGECKRRAFEINMKDIQCLVVAKGGPVEDLNLEEGRIKK